MVEKGITLLELEQREALPWETDLMPVGTVSVQL
jgi:hypothetical protein